MKTMVARCGFRCDQCGAFVTNSPTAADRLEAAAVWSNYFGLSVRPRDMRCNGCLAKDRHGYKFPQKNCATRKCVIRRGLGNCAECVDYPCEQLEKRMKGVEKVLKKYRNTVSREEFICCLAPYDARTTLNRLRRT